MLEIAVITLDKRPCEVYQKTPGHLSPCVLPVAEPRARGRARRADWPPPRGRRLSVGLLRFCCLGNITVRFLLMHHRNVSRLDGLELGLKEFCMFFIKSSFFF